MWAWKAESWVEISDPPSIKGTLNSGYTLESPGDFFFFLIPMLGPTSDKINQNLQENSMISAFLKTPSDHAISISYGNLDK